MFIEHRTYQLRTGAGAEYLAGLGEAGIELQRRHMAPCVGHYVTEVGPLSQVVVLWRHDSFEARIEGRRRLYDDPAWRDIIARVSPLVTQIDTKLLLPTPHWDGEYGR